MSIYSFTITLLFVMDPLGNIPVFLSILQKFNPRLQIKIILRESLIAYAVLLVFLFGGNFLMHGLHISTAALSVAGGIILFLIAIRMIFPVKKLDGRDEIEEPLVVPLAVPLTAGPSALAVLVLFSSRYPEHMSILFGAVTIAIGMFVTIMLVARLLMEVLGKRGLIAIERLMGMILTMIAVQMLLSGIHQYITNPNMF